MNNNQISPNTTDTDSNCHELVSMVVANQLVGIPVGTVRDILGPQRITRVPLSSSEVAGVLNLRGRIVTAIDLCRRLGIQSNNEPDEPGMSIVVEHDGELYSLLIDQVGEVLHATNEQLVKDTASLSNSWREIADGIFRLEDRLLVLLDVGRVLDFDS